MLLQCGLCSVEQCLPVPWSSHWAHLLTHSCFCNHLATWFSKVVLLTVQVPQWGWLEEVGLNCALSLQQSLLFTGYYIYLFYHPQRGFLSWPVIAVRRDRYFFKLNIFSNSIPNLLYSSRKVKVKLWYVFTIKTKYVLMT